MPTTLGNIDNYCKFFLDAIDIVFFSNDKNIVQIKATNIRPYTVNILNLTDNEENGGNSENENGI